jgi:hypothetical protein
MKNKIIINTKDLSDREIDYLKKLIEDFFEEIHELKSLIKIE